jgi:hypothetical protein
LDGQQIDVMGLMGNDADMAHRLDSFDESVQAPRRYPWNEWADGAPWQIRRGEDYDVATENMRVSLHMRAKQMGCKVQTRKVADSAGEGLVFQFLPQRMDPMVERNPEELSNALERLYRDCQYIYETARREVTIPRIDGTVQKYAAIRFMQQIDRAYADGRLVRAVESIVERRTAGFGHLEAAGREDLMLETFLLDRAKPYHLLISDRTRAIAEARIADYRRRRNER